MQRLLADTCELCGSAHQVEVHHIRALKDLNPKGRKQPPEWAARMASRRRKTLVVCRACHEGIHYSGSASRQTTMSTGEPDATEIGHVRFGKGVVGKGAQHSHLAGDLLHRTPGSAGGPGKRSRWQTGTAPRADPTIQPLGVTSRTVPGQCKGRAHRRSTLGLPGRRVLVSRKWSGKTLADHRADRWRSSHKHWRRSESRNRHRTPPG